MDDGRRNLLGVMLAANRGRQPYLLSRLSWSRAGAGNSINALLDAWLLTEDNSYLAKAQALIRRCIHPCDDLVWRDLGNAEVRWSYTVFLQTLCRYVELTKDLSELATIHTYIRESLLHYARWMVKHERFYLDEPEKLQYPTETWAAQELRKGTVLLMAARHATGSETKEFVIRGREILNQAWQCLASFSTCHCTRPVALALQQGYLETYLVSPEEAEICTTEPSAADRDFGQPSSFVPQKSKVRHAIRSPVGIFQMLGNACRPAGWLNAWHQTWIAERVRRLFW